MVEEFVRMECFPGLEKLEDPEARIREAREAVLEFRRWTDPHVRDLTEEEERAAARTAAERQAAAAR